MNKILYAAAAAGALLLSACATATPYQPIGATRVRGGYAEERISSDRFRVTFSGNSVTSRDTVEMYLLYRAAELTLADGFDCFETANRSTDRDTRYVGTPDPFWSGSPWGPYWHPYWRHYSRFGWSRWDPFWGDDWDVREVTRYEASAEVIMRKGACPAGDRYAFDAHEVIDHLGPRVVRPGAPDGRM
jgi:hypothetical protein